VPPSSTTVRRTSFPSSAFHGNFARMSAALLSVIEYMYHSRQRIPAYIEPATLVSIFCMKRARKALGANLATDSPKQMHSDPHSADGLGHRSILHIRQQSKYAMAAIFAVVFVCSGRVRRSISKPEVLSSRRCDSILMQSCCVISITDSYAHNPMLSIQLRM
jgi:hypothetical protein